jgi:hypothetical protein
MTQSIRPALPPLPEPAYGDCDVVKDEAGAFTADQLRADRRQIVELCAAVCIEQGRKADNIDGEAFYIATGQCAAAILALLDGEAK